jgi:tetratricopeptide (TPR) repeat protein
LLISGAAFAAYSYSADAYYVALTATNARQAGNPLFPAGTRTGSAEGWEDAPSAASCGAKGCHPEIVEQWRGSGHARAEADPAYVRTLAEAEGKLGVEGARWCQGCHGPSGLLTASATPGAQRMTPASGVDCLSCHAMSEVPAATGNGHAVYTAPPTYPFARSQDGTGRWVHDFLLRVRPAPHRAGLSGPKPGISGSQMCAPCHRLSVNMPQNHYKFLRYDNTWADWQSSPYSGESLHTYTTAPRKDCVSCHMPAAGTSPDRSRFHDHACLSTPPSALPSDALKVEIFAVRHDFGKPGVPERVEAPLPTSSAAARPGEAITLDVLVENRGIGHAFPSGVPDLRDAWLALTVTDAAGKPLFQSDMPPHTSSIEHRPSKIDNPNLHRYGLLALDRGGRPVERGNMVDMVAPVYNRSVAAGEGEVARYRFTVPKSARGPLRLTAALKYRRFNAAFAKMSGVGALPIRTSTEHSVEIVVTQQPAGHDAASADPQTAKRLAAYGGALLNQTDSARARVAFLKAFQLEPTNPEHLVGLARCYLAEGDLLAARDQLHRALGLQRDSARANAWLGTTLRYMGQFDAALRILEPLARDYPRDRLLWSDIGWCHLQSLRFEAAATAFSRMIEIDPDDAGAHYNLMRCYIGLRRVADARREEVIFRTLQDDEALTQVVDPYLNKHPWARREALPIHEHVLEPVR